MATGLGTLALTLTADDKQLQAALTKAERGANKAGRQITKEFDKSNKAANASFTGLGTNATRSMDRIKNSIGGAKNAIRGMSASLESMGGVIAGLGLGALAVGIAAVGNSAYQAAVRAESLTKSFTNVFRTSAAGAKELQYVKDTAEKLGLELVSTEKAYLSLAASSKGTALEGKKTRDVFEAVSKAGSNLGLTAEQTEGSLLAVQQMISKGTVSAEELRGQLGERLPGAFQIAARSMGVTTEKLDEMLRKGEVTAEKFIPAFSAQLGKEFPKAVDGSNQAMNRLKNQMELLNRQMGATFAPAVTAGIKALTDALAKLPEIAGQIMGWWNQLNPATKTLIETVGVGVGIFTALSAAVLAAVGAFSLLSVAVGALWAALAPVLPLLLAITAALTVAYVIWKNWGTIVKWTGDILRGLGDWLKGVGKGAIDLWNASIKTSSSILGNFKQIAVDVFSKVKNTVTGFGRAALDLFTKIIDKVGEMMKVFEPFKDIVGGALEGAGAVAKKVFGGVNSLAIGTMDAGAGGGGILGGGSGNLSSAKGLAGSMGLTMTSHLRPGDKGSLHSVGRAMDFSNGTGPTPQMMQFANAAAERWGSSIKELIYTPLGWSIKNGKKVPPYAQAEHYNHVHIAFNKGGMVPGSGNSDTVPAMLTPGEFVLTKEQVKDMQFFKRGGLVEGTKTKASWYGPGFHGKRTASGEIFNENALTAASKSLAFGTKVRVTNVANGKSVVVRINDDGPHVKGRGIDLSKAAARAIGISGVGDVVLSSPGSSSIASSSSSDTQMTEAQRLAKKREDEIAKGTEAQTKFMENRMSKEEPKRASRDRGVKEVRAGQDSAHRIARASETREPIRQLMQFNQDALQEQRDLNDKIVPLQDKLADLRAGQANKVKNKLKGGTDYAAAIKATEEEINSIKKVAAAESKANSAERKAEIAKINKELTNSVFDLVDAQKQLNFQYGFITPMDEWNAKQEELTHSYTTLNNKLQDEINLNTRLLQMNPDDVEAKMRLTKATEAQKQAMLGYQESLQKLDLDKQRDLEDRQLASNQMLVDSNNALLEAKIQQNQWDTYGVENLERELALSQEKTRHEQRLLELTRLRADILNGITLGNTAQVDQMISNENQINAINNKLLEQRSYWHEIGATLKEGLGGALKGLLTGATTLGEALKGILDNLVGKLADMALAGLMPAIFGGTLPGGAGTSQGIFGGLFTGFANGGVVKSPTLAMVGEGRFHEAVVPMPNGKSIPVDLGESNVGGATTIGNIVVNVNSGQSTGAEQARLIAKTVETTVISTLEKQKRPGGSLGNYGRIR